ncbi:MAG: DUF1080 domain-containing protein [Planctomycetia bacterium]
MASRMLQALILLLASTAAAAAPPEPPPGFVPLFNGRDLAGWYGWDTRDPAELRRMTPEERDACKRKSIVGDPAGSPTGDQLAAHWRVEDGVLVNDGQGLYLTSDRDFGDFELLVDYAMQPRGDSGVYLRGVPQVQIWDWTEEQKFSLGADKGSGGLWNNKGPGKLPLKRMDRPFGEWNTLRIKMIGERVTVWLNGEIVVNDAVLENYFAAARLAAADKAAGRDPAAPRPAGFFPDPVDPRGPIQLQTHGSEIRWRNVLIRESPAAEADRELAARDAAGFVEQVNGRDLSNWRGAVDSYEIRDGAIRCRPGASGDLLTADEFGDCVIRVEFRLPPAGNNGIALRTPIGGQAAADGLEIQVLDSDGYNARQSAKGAKLLEPYQYHGSLYHCVGAKHGYLRPAGEWNFEEIEVRGQRVKVTLNGTKILDVDLATIDRGTLPQVPKGLDRTRGHLGFSGHHDPVEYRSFKVKPL